MLGVSKKEIHLILKTGANDGGMSLADLRAEIEQIINNPINSTDPDV